VRLIPALALVCVALAGPGADVLPAPELPAASPAQEDLQPYVETIPGTELTIEMVPIPGGSFQLGSPEDETDRSADEGPPVEVSVGPFWMAKYEVTWDLYDAFRATGRTDSATDADSGDILEVDAVTRPTNRYGDESFGFGKGRRPVVGISHHAAMEFARWLSVITGKAYRLPTEAEWEYACEAGTTSAYSFGDDPSELDTYAWYADNSDFETQPVGRKLPNPWGVHDLHGNVAEFCLDHYDAEAYSRVEPGTKLPVVLPTAQRYPHVVRGGSWDDEPPMLRCAARHHSSPSWSKRDPQQPKGIWWHTDASYTGFRVVRAVEEDERLKGIRSQITSDSQ
jgi:formylglycine-generating enzyme required for sulfatase activity